MRNYEFYIVMEDEFGFYNPLIFLVYSSIYVRLLNKLVTRHIHQKITYFYFLRIKLRKLFLKCAFNIQIKICSAIHST